METIQKKLGQKIREQRGVIGLSQEGLADACGLHRTYIGSIERGERNVSLQNIVLIARALSVSPSTLLSGIE
ncbi:helix-turn-helix domain-containing protein [Methylovulum psychrotolerans]|jgi:transcriptional regulator with XRE-family HTH domain|uniref:Transcriptional regulator n=1 Tax=Methylovulum psychrotolerans TaxID=1704499 RepID=A0A1Z4BVH6_9GAMM|nr:helix-turn-helix transcriptional regulator [Methylovulum psychrotolerans]ASF45253.1 transcriptional regulator [Methylovulum psychrotolerans]